MAGGDGRYLVFFQAWQAGGEASVLTTYPFLGRDGWFIIDAQEMTRPAGGPKTWSSLGWNDPPAKPLQNLYATVQAALNTH